MPEARKFSKMAHGLSEIKARLAAKEYLENGQDAEKALLAVGYSESSAKSKKYKLLKHPEFIRLTKLPLAKEVVISRETINKRLLKVIKSIDSYIDDGVNALQLPAKTLRVWLETIEVAIKLNGLSETLDTDNPANTKVNNIKILNQIAKGGRNGDSQEQLKADLKRNISALYGSSALSDRL